MGSGNWHLNPNRPYCISRLINNIEPGNLAMASRQDLRPVTQGFWFLSIPRWGFRCVPRRGKKSLSRISTLGDPFVMLVFQYYPVSSPLASMILSLYCFCLRSVGCGWQKIPAGCLLLLNLSGDLISQLVDHCFLVKAFEPFTCVKEALL